MFSQNELGKLIFSQAPSSGAPPGVSIPAWNVKCRVDSEWEEQARADSSLDKCNKDL